MSARRDSRLRRCGSWVGSSGEPLDARANARIDVDVTNGIGHAEIQPVGEPVGGVDDHALRRESKRERGFDEVAFERRVEAAAVAGRGTALCRAAAVDVLDVKNDFAVTQVLALERVVGRAQVADAQTSAIATNRQRTLSEQWAEALASTTERSELRIEGIRETADDDPTGTVASSVTSCWLNCCGVCS